jgi:hypothetical protein
VYEHVTSVASLDISADGRDVLILVDRQAEPHWANALTMLVEGYVRRVKVRAPATRLEVWLEYEPGAWPRLVERKEHVARIVLGDNAVEVCQGMVFSAIRDGRVQRGMHIDLSFEGHAGALTVAHFHAER